MTEAAGAAAGSGAALVLVGPMAAGKTSIGRRVAKDLGWPFVDTDQRIVAEHGEITAIFAELGEAGFRRIEEETVARELATPGPRVVALGGGAVLSAATRERLGEHRVALLLTTAEAVLTRTHLDKRPLLRDDPGAWARIFAERKPLYEAVADASWHTDRRPKDQIAADIVRWLKEQI